MVKSVFVNGTFDILHPGHMELLRYAKSHGDRLLVAIDNDERVRKLKGDDRPINTAWYRKRMLEATKWVDEVIIFSSESELEAIVEKIKPEHMVVGSDYRNKKVIGSEWAKQLHFFERINDYSTTKAISGIINRG